MNSDAQSSPSNGMKWPGSRWWRFDFHTHTPASSDYRGDAGITPEEWLLGFMRAGVDCVAVTDHNSGGWIDRLKAAMDSKALQEDADYRPLILFPGVELSVSGGVHLLALCDPSCGAAQVEALRGAVGYQGTPGSSDAVTEKSLLQCIKEALKHRAIPIPAHVDGEKGLLKAVTDHNTLKPMLEHLTAVEVADSTSETFKGKGAVLRGLSLVSGSDSHRPAAIGRHCWIKMSRPNIEGLRLALLDGELAVRRQEDLAGNPNRTAPQWISRLCLRKLKLRQYGDLEVRLNPWFNAIIGGRGSGKSTLLECLRIGLNRGDELSDLLELKSQFNKFQKVSSGGNSDGAFLAESELEVEYLKDDAAHRMHWRGGDAAPLLMEADGEQWREAGKVIPSRFPVRIYSQKQVFEMATKPHTLRRLMDEDPDLDKLGWQQEWNELQARFLNLSAEHRRLGEELTERERIEGELRDIQRKLRVFDQSRHADVLKSFQQSQRQQALVDRHLRRLHEQVDGLKAALEAGEAAEFGFDPQSRFDEQNAGQRELLDLFGDLAQDLSSHHQRLRSTVTAMQQRLQQAQEALNASAWQAVARAQREAYEQLEVELEQQGIASTNEYGQLVQRQQLHESRLKKLDAKQLRQSQLRQQCEATYAELKRQRLELTARRRSFVTRVLSQNQYVKVELKPFGDLRQAEKDFRDLIGKPGTTYEDDILGEDENRGFIHDLYMTEEGQSDPDGVADRIDTLKEELERPGEYLLLHTTIHKPLLKHLDGLRKQTPEVLDRLWCWFPEDEVQVKYRQPGGGFNSIDQASAGQKTSAILSFLMAYGSEPLILDQPEDDLDNALIYELIVKQLRENKARRQIIVVTHNPNIVVHGDAEWVLPLKIHKGSITAQCPGGLQEISVRRAVCDIMEGGVEAFEQRYRKIHDQVRVS